jgi:hypothetical protein
VRTLACHFLAIKTYLVFRLIAERALDMKEGAAMYCDRRYGESRSHSAYFRRVSSNKSDVASGPALGTLKSAVSRDILRRHARCLPILSPNNPKVSPLPAPQITSTIYLLHTSFDLCLVCASGRACVIISNLCEDGTFDPAESPPTSVVHLSSTCTFKRSSAH